MQTELIMNTLPVWIVSVASAALMIVKAALWIRQSGSTSNGSTQAEFRGAVKILLNNQFDLLKEIHTGIEQDRNRWSPVIEKLLAAQNRTMEMLADHDKQERKVWREMLEGLKKLNRREP